MTLVRAPRFADLPGIYRVCDETGPATRNPDLLGHIYAGPYVRALPEFSRIVADDEGVAGYLFGCPDTRAFEAWCETEWWPPLREQYPPGCGGPDRFLVDLLHHPEPSPAELIDAFPAHLHIDLLPRAQGRGLGRILLEWLFATLADAGTPGVHLGVGADNANAIAFYEHLGFAGVSGDDDTRWMARAL